MLGVGVELHDELGEVGVESEHEVADRIAAALAGIADRYRGEAVLVVGHQAAFGLALARLLPGAPAIGLDPAGRWPWSTTRTAGRWERRVARSDTSARKNTHFGSADEDTLRETRLGLPYRVLVQSRPWERPRPRACRRASAA